MYLQLLKLQRKHRLGVWGARIHVCQAVRGHVVEIVKQDVSTNAKVVVKQDATQDVRMNVGVVASIRVPHHAQVPVKIHVVTAAHVLVIN